MTVDTTCRAPRFVRSTSAALRAACTTVKPLACSADSKLTFSRTARPMLEPACGRSASSRAAMSSVNNDGSSTT